MIQQPSEISESVGRFTFNRTLERDMIHRSAVSEVFITDYTAIDDDNWLVGAQLPTAHAYYGDVWAGGLSSCPLVLLLECCRQAATYGSYSRFGNAADTVNMIKSIEIDVPDIGNIEFGDMPVQLVIAVEATDVVVKNGVRKAATPRVSIFHDGSQIGTASIPVALASKRLFESLRRRQRGSNPPTTKSLPFERPSAPVEAADLGLSNVENVVIAHPRFATHALVTELALLGSNKSLLDHEYDHVPAMALIEGARQTAILAARECWPLSQYDAIVHLSLKAVFGQFAEVDECTEFEARIPTSPRADIRTTFEVRARQGSGIVAEFQFGFQPAGGAPAGR